MYYKQAQEHFIKHWLIGTTCHRNCKPEIKWTDSSGRFILVFHHPHSSYVGRNEIENCPSYQRLYDLDICKEDTDGYAKKHLAEWKGRWNKLKQKEMEEMIEKINHQDDIEDTIDVENTEDII